MSQYKLTKKAVNDLTTIWEYTFKEWSIEQANKYYGLLISSFSEITKNPKIGKNYENVSKELKGFRVNKHIIFYRTNESDYIEITRILHANMDLKKRIK